MFDQIMRVNRRFTELNVDTVAEKKILEGVMILDEYRLYPLFAQRQPVRQVVDVGGHYGSFTSMVKILWPDSNVLAYEPCRESARKFLTHTSGLSSVTLHATAALSSADPRTAEGKASLQIHQNAGANSTEMLVSDDLETVDVRCLLTDLRTAGSPAIDVLKFDCEGAEGALLADLADANYLRRIDYVCGEWHGEHNAQAVERLLSQTHSVQVYRHSWPWGAFFATRK